MTEKDEPKAKANNEDKVNNADKDPDYFELDFSLKRLNYKKYLVGESIKNFLAMCGCDDKADIADFSTLNKTAHAYRRYLYHLCTELDLNTDQIVKKYKKLHRFSFEFEDIIQQKCTRLRAEVNRKIMRNGKTIMKSGQKVAMFIYAWEKFCRANRFKMDWDSIRETIPKNQIRKAARDEAYTREQIKTMLPYATDLRVKVAILFMSSGGLRREAMTTLLDKHVSPIEIDGKLVCAKVITYNEDEGTYITFITLEAYNLYLEYRKQRERYGEVFDGNNPAIIEKFDVWKNKIYRNKAIAPSSLDRLVSAVLVASGVRERSDFYTHRYKVKCLHGFHSYFYETLKKVRIGNSLAPAIPLELCHTLLGDKSETIQRASQDSSYDKKTDKEFTERELREAYILAIPDLTISDEARERAEKERVKVELKSMESLELELEKVRQEKNQGDESLKDEVRQLREIILEISNSGRAVPLKASSGETGVITTENRVGSEFKNWKILYVKDKDGNLRLRPTSTKDTKDIKSRKK